MSPVPVFNKCHGGRADWGLKGNVIEQKKERKRKEKEASIYSCARHCHICYFIESTLIYPITLAGGYFQSSFFFSFFFFVDEEMEVQKG